MESTKFVHSEDFYNLTSPKEIVPVLVKIFHPKSVVDVGCGLGTFLYCFKQHGVHRVLGMDGKWVDKTLLKKYIEEDEFIEIDLQNSVVHKEKFDLAISLEVAEHLRFESADKFIENITSLSDNVVFSAAIPGQGGQDHINEQWPSYWIEKFEKHGYICHDILRPYFWNNPDVFWWYKQNILIFSKNKSFNYSFDHTKPLDLVHPDHLKERYTNAGFSFVLKLFIKVLTKRLNINK